MGRKLLETVVSVAAFFAIWTVMRDGCFERTEDVDAIELVATTGNPSPSSKEIVSWFRTLDRDQPFTITDIGRDHVGGRFLSALKDPRALARRFNDFCPDIVRQGTGSVRNLEIELRESQYLYCWWD